MKSWAWYSRRCGTEIPAVSSSRARWVWARPDWLGRLSPCSTATSRSSGRRPHPRRRRFRSVRWLTCFPRSTSSPRRTVCASPAASPAPSKPRARGRPLILAVDDAQWLDAGAAALVHQLAVTGQSAPLAHAADRRASTGRGGRVLEGRPDPAPGAATARHARPRRAGRGRTRPHRGPSDAPKVLGPEQRQSLVRARARAWPHSRPMRSRSATTCGAGQATTSRPRACP